MLARGWCMGFPSPMLLATVSGALFRIPQDSWREQHQAKLTTYTKPPHALREAFAVYRPLFLF